MKTADLHTHTYYSDGELSPEELVRKAKEKGIKYLAITDHNSIKGNQDAIKEGKKIGVKVIPGVEVAGQDFEVLGYFIDYKNKGLKKGLLRCGYYANEKVKRITELLEIQGENISFEDLKKKFPYAENNYNNGHLFYYLMSKGHTFDNAVEKVMKVKKKIRKPKRKNVSVVRAINLIKEYGGVPVLSHPWLEKEKFVEENIKKYVEAGLKGIEYDNGEKNFLGRDEKFKRRIKKFSKKYNLILTQGSDYHGPIMFNALKRHELGEYNCSEEVVEKLKDTFNLN